MRFFTTFRHLPQFFMNGAACGMAALTACAALAQPGAPSPIVASQSAAPQLLGALILSPGQRRNLEAVRHTSGDAAVTPVAADRLQDASTLPDTLVVSGVVVRSGNRSTVWVNDQPLYGRAVAHPLRSLAGQAGVLQSGTSAMQLKARPGQVIDVPSGQTVDLLPPGAIRIIPPKADLRGGANKEYQK